MDFANRQRNRFRMGPEVTGSHKTGGLRRAAGQGLAAQPHPITPARNRASVGDQGSPRNSVPPREREQATLGYRLTTGSGSGRVCGGWGQTWPQDCCAGLPHGGVWGPP